MTSIINKISTLIISMVLTMGFVHYANAHSYKIADLEIKHPHAQAPLGNARVAGGYLTIINSGSSDDRLISVKVDFAKRSNTHEMKMEGDVMKMRMLEHGIEIPAGETVILSSGSNHIMFEGLKEKLVSGDKRKGVLVFEKAGEIEVKFSFKSLAEIKARAKKNAAKMDMKHDDMNHNKMDKMKHN